MLEARTKRPPEELLAQLVFQLNTALGGKGYRLTSRGPAGLAYRRAAGGMFYGGVGLAVLGLLVLLGGAPEGLVFLAPGLVMLALRFPAQVSLALSSVGGETQITAKRAFGPVTRDDVGPAISAAIERAL